MTDARLPVEWLDQMIYDDISDRLWRVYTRGLQWSNAQGTDGVIPRRYLARLHPEGAVPADAEALVRAGLWMVTSEGWAFPDWGGRLRQSTAAEVEAYKEAGRKRAANSRARALGLAEPFPKPSKSPSRGAAKAPANVHPNVPENVGTASGKASASASALDAGADSASHSYWPVVQIGQQAHKELEAF